MSRPINKRLATSQGCIPLLELIRAAQNTGWSTWASAEAAFLEAIWGFDRNFIDGVATQGDNQNGKGDFFTDFMCILLERCSGKALGARPTVPGRIFQNNALDAAYPPSGVVEVLIETKVAGAPRTRRNPSQRNPLGRPGSADLDKRIKEAGLKTNDLKAEWARTAGRGGGPGGDFITWLRRSRPSCFLFLAVRVVDDSDLRRAIRLADASNQVMDGCGLCYYFPTTSGYVVREVPVHLQLDRVFSRVCDELRQLA